MAKCYSGKRPDEEGAEGGVKGNRTFLRKKKRNTKVSQKREF